MRVIEQPSRQRSGGTAHQRGEPISAWGRRPEPEPLTRSAPGVVSSLAARAHAHRSPLTAHRLPLSQPALQRHGVPFQPQQTTLPPQLRLRW